jgi:Fe-S-cluster containining protein
MPEDKQLKIRARFEAGLDRLRKSGMLERLFQLDQIWGDELIALVMDYFRLWIDCPFLDGEVCSIYTERPMSCREHMVTSPAENCANPSQEGIERLPIPVETVSRALKCFNTDESFRLKGWIPLILALEWAEAHPDEPHLGRGPELLANFFRHLVEKEISEPAT